MKKIIDVLFWIIIIAWVGVCVTDYYNVQNKKDPMFCIKQGAKTYSDGTVKWCTGAGYKIYNYDRANFKAYEYGPFWIEEKDNNNS